MNVDDAESGTVKTRVDRRAQLTRPLSGEAQQSLFGATGEAAKHVYAEPAASLEGHQNQTTSAKKARAASMACNAAASTTEENNMAAFDILGELIDQHWGSLGGANLEPTHEAQVAGLNQFIVSESADKAKTLLCLLNIEGIYVSSKGSQPPPLLTLACQEPFAGVMNVWARLLALGADPDEEFNGKTATREAVLNSSPVRFHLADEE